MIPGSAWGKSFCFLLKEDLDVSMILGWYWSVGFRLVYLKILCHFLGDGGFPNFHCHLPDFVGLI
jgi:hypothetical protein